MKSKHRIKRESLELFLKEQLVGPGAYNNRYHFRDEIESSDYYNVNLHDNPGISNVNEVLPEVPAYQYGTGILFPQTKYSPIKEAERISNSIADDNDNVDTTDNLDDVAEINQSADDEHLSHEPTESLISKQQNYPSEFGLTFVVDEKADLNQDLLIELTFRQYRKVQKFESRKRNISIYIREYAQEITTIIEKYFNAYFACFKKLDNTFIHANKKLEYSDFYDIDYVCLNNLLHDGLIIKLKKYLGDTLEEIKSSGDTLTYGMEDEQGPIAFYTLGNKPYGQGYSNVVTLFDSQLTTYLKNLLKEDIHEYLNLKEIIKELEIYNQVKIAVNDLKSIFRKKGATPVWQSKGSKLQLELPKYHGRPIQRESRLIIDSKYDDLTYSVQYLRNNRHSNGELYIKILVQNMAWVELKPNEPPMLNKKDEANQKAYFGISLRVKENRKEVLRPYNSLQFLAFDDEDNFNKLLYRQFLDYGEGYNVSVNWGRSNGNLRFVATEFLPEEETPKVSFTPTRIHNGKAISRLPNDKILSLKQLSTLSEADDEQIIGALDSLVDQYTNWIDEKTDDIGNEPGSNLLKRQIKACRADQNRLKRNINLLRTNREALIAFRLMNTAMLMQLHHSRLKKAKSKDLVGVTMDENYYKKADTDDYKWRSFQLAFVLLNVDAFVKPSESDNTTKDVFGSGWPERNEVADLVWFPTGGGKTEAYLGIIAFCIIFRRFTNKESGYGTSVIMRYTLRLLTLQQFQRATLLICAIEVIRKAKFTIPLGFDLGTEKITIGLFVGSGSLPNKWSGSDESMLSELNKISNTIKDNKEKEEKAKRQVKTNLPFTECPWCGEDLFTDQHLENISPNHLKKEYRINDELMICCNNKNCHYHADFVDTESSLPLRLFDEDIYKYPPTLLFGTVDKFAALANRVSSATSDRNFDSRRFFGWRQTKQEVYPPDLIIQDELHLLLGPLGTAVGLFEKAIDKLCTYENKEGHIIKPKIITSTATTRNTDKQIFALFNRRSEIFPKQGIAADDSFFAHYERNCANEFVSNRKYIGVLPIGKTQVWMQLRIASIALAHRLKYLKENFTLDEFFEPKGNLDSLKPVVDYYHTVLSYFNSLKEVGKTQSQLGHYLPGDLNYIIKNTVSWSFIDKIARNESEIHYTELTGRLTGEEVKTNLSLIEKKWELIEKDNGKSKLNDLFPPEYVIATNMISVGIDVSRFNTMIISSMPRNIAEYIQASSRVARESEGIVFTVHHPFRSRDISHYQRFKEFHEKFYSYVEPISVTPFATKALDRYLAMYLAVLIRHNDQLQLMNNNQVANSVEDKRQQIIEIVNEEISTIYNNAKHLDKYLKSLERTGIPSSVEGIIDEDELNEIKQKAGTLLNKWIDRLEQAGSDGLLDEMLFRHSEDSRRSLFIAISNDQHPLHWKVGHSLREIAPSTVVKTVQQ